MRWQDLGPYHEGTDDEGHERFSIPMETDEDGMVGRQCPREECRPRYFKVAPPTVSADGDQPSNSASLAALHCPYCGHAEGFQQFITDEQRQWLRSLLTRDVAREFQRMLGNAFGRGRSSGPISIEYRPGSLPSVRQYQERELKRIVECEPCHRRYAVYGVATFCPFCRQGNLHHHFQRSASIVRTLLASVTAIAEAGGKEAEYHHLCNCLEDCVGLFEGFLRQVYAHALLSTVAPAVREQKLNQLRNGFQNPTRAAAIFQTDFGWDLFGGTSPDDREFLGLQFAKRHVITHNLGLVDERYLTQVQSWQRAGEDVEVGEAEVARLLTILEAVIQRAIQQFV